MCFGEEGDLGRCLSDLTRLEGFELSSLPSGLTPPLEEVDPRPFMASRVDWGDGEFVLVAVCEACVLSPFGVRPGKARRRRSEPILG